MDASKAAGGYYLMVLVGGPYSIMVLPQGPMLQEFNREAVPIWKARPMIFSIYGSYINYFNAWSGLDPPNISMAIAFGTSTLNFLSLHFFENSKRHKPIPNLQ